MSYSIENCVKGSVLPGKFIENLKYGDSLDIMVVGDSNCHYGEPATQSVPDYGIRIFGLADAIAKILMDQGYNLYATPLYPVGIGSNTFKCGLGSSVRTGDQRSSSALFQGLGSVRLNRTQDTTSGILVGYLGSVYDKANTAFSSLPDDFTFFYNEMSKDKLATAVGSLKQGFYSHDPSNVGVPAATNWFMLTTTQSGVTGRQDSLFLDGSPWLDAAKWDNSNLYFRLTHSSSPNGGSVNLSVLRDIGSGNSNQGAGNLTFATKDTNETGYRFKDSEIVFNTLSQGATPVTSSNLVRATGVTILFSGGFSNLTAPIGLFFMSVYEKKPGFSVNLLQCEGQALPEDHINKFKEVIENGNYIKQFFKALIRRQKAANPKSSGKALIVFQAGTNTFVGNQGQYVASPDAVHATNRVKQSFDQSIALLRKEWIDCGFAPSDLAFIVAGGPVTNNTFSDSISKLLYDTSGNSEVTVVDHVKSLPRSDYVANLYWDSNLAPNNENGTGSATPATHLAEPGYFEWGKAIILNVLNYSRKTFKQKRG